MDSHTATVSASVLNRAAGNSQGACILNRDAHHAIFSGNHTFAAVADMQRAFVCDVVVCAHIQRLSIQAQGHCCAAGNGDDARGGDIAGQIIIAGCDITAGGCPLHVCGAVVVTVGYGPLGIEGNIGGDGGGEGKFIAIGAAFVRIPAAEDVTTGFGGGGFGGSIVFRYSLAVDCIAVTVHLESDGVLLLYDHGDGHLHRIALVAVGVCNGSLPGSEGDQGTGFRVYCEVCFIISPQNLQFRRVEVIDICRIAGLQGQGLTQDGGGSFGKGGGQGDGDYLHAREGPCRHGTFDRIGSVCEVAVPVPFRQSRADTVHTAHNGEILVLAAVDSQA